MTVFHQIEKSLHFFAIFYKKYSESTAGNGTQRKTVIFTVDIFAVYMGSDSFVDTRGNPIAYLLPMYK